MKKHLSILGILIGLNLNIFSAGISHEIWNNLLKKHVSATGIVNYKGFIKDSVELNKYLDLLSKNEPDEKTWSKNEQMAFWINAYNAFTVKLIVKNYPVKSIKDLGGSVPFVNTAWDKKFFKIGNDKMDLNNIEHGKLRRKFKDYRIHLALVCASRSCPILRNEAFMADKLDAQLDDQGKKFLADTFRNKVTPDAPQLSKIFDWYKMDFPNDQKFIDLINSYSAVKINPKAKISFLDYDWNLNEK